MSVEDWARREADRIRREDSAMLTYDMEEDAFAAGIVHAFDSLLSDEACDEIAKVVWGSMLGNDRIVVRAALEAAVRAVTDPKTHDSSTTTTGEHRG